MSQKSRHSTCEKRLSIKESPSKKHTCKDVTNTIAPLKAENYSKDLPNPTSTCTSGSKSARRNAQKSGNISKVDKIKEGTKQKQTLLNSTSKSSRKAEKLVGKQYVTKTSHVSNGRDKSVGSAKMENTEGMNSSATGSVLQDVNPASHNPADSSGTSNGTSPNASDSGKGSAAAIGYMYEDLKSNIDSSDIEVLPDKDSSDSIEILDSEEGNARNLSANDFSESASLCSVRTITDQVTDSGTTPVKEILDSKDASKSTEESCAENLETLNISAEGAKQKSAKSAPKEQKSHYPIDAVVQVAGDKKVGEAGNSGENAESIGDLISFVSPTGVRDPMGFAASSLPPQLEHGGMSHYDYAASEFMANGGLVSRPDSLSLPRPLQHYERNKFLKQSSESSGSEALLSCSSTEELIQTVSSTPLQSQGTVTKDGDMINFIAEDLTEKIKRSSPLTKREGSSWIVSRTPSSRSLSSVHSVSSTTSGWSSSSASGWSHITSSGVSRSPSVVTQSPEDMPPVDPHILLDLETHAQNVAHNLETMMTNMKTSLHKMSGLTLSCVSAYKDGIDRTCDSVDASIKSMYALMAKCEELSRSMQPVYTLADEVKEIKRLLELFESHISKDD